MSELKGLILFAATTCLIFLSLTSESLSQDREASSTSPRLRSGFILPKIFEFEHFKASFKKHYNSLVEQVVRQKFYMGRAFRAFISAVTYRHRKSSFYLAINQMSDWTIREIKMIQMSREDALEDEDLRSSDRRKLNDDDEDDDDVPLLQKSTADSSIPAANLEDILKKLSEISSYENRDKPGYEEIYQELKKHRLFRRKRSLRSTQSLRELHLDDLIHEPARENSGEISSIVPSNNPNYEPVELHSYGIEKDNNDHLAIEDADAINSIPGVEFINNVVRATSNLFNSLQESPFIGEFNKNIKKQEEGDTKLEAEDEESETDELFIDHRDTNCFFEPRDQGKCGSCYVFAPIALYEWFYCMATGSKVAFSEQYPIDCGNRLLGLKGCKGGRFNRVSPFVQLFGIELRKNYPYRQKNDTCPYEENTPSTSMGYLRIFDKGFKHFLIDDVEEQLKLAPMVMNMKLHSKFSEYGGGVDDGSDCGSTTGLHSVVLIGSGREEGEDYWLIRNSYSVSWGERGYYRLNKKANCLDPDKAFTLDGVKILAAHTNAKYTGALPLKRRYAEYMKEGIRSMSKRENNGDKSR